MYCWIHFILFFSCEHCEYIRSFSSIFHICHILITFKKIFCFTYAYIVSIPYTWMFFGSIFSKPSFYLFAIENFNHMQSRKDTIRTPILSLNFNNYQLVTCIFHLLLTRITVFGNKFISQWWLHECAACAVIPVLMLWRDPCLAWCFDITVLKFVTVCKGPGLQPVLILINSDVKFLGHFRA